MTDLTAKARRAAEWWNSQCHFSPVFAKTIWLSRDARGKKLDMDDEQLIKTSNKLGWQDQETDEPSDAAYIALVEACEQEGMMDVKESEKLLNSIRSGNPPDGVDGVQWVTTHECHRFAEDVWLNVYNCYDRGFAWEVFIIGPEHGAKAKGTAPTRAEARRQAVESARGMG